jgi:phenylpyruvate tautomerase PptA (4-oxalocrotonate tautomerase family)
MLGGKFWATLFSEILETPMPLVKIHILKGRSPSELDVLLDTIHDVVVESFRVPPRDRYQILQEHQASHVRALDTGLDITRSERFLLLEITSRPRSRDAKVAFYSSLTRALQTKCNVAPSDVMVCLNINSDEDWSFGMGSAQFLTGEL